MSVPTPRLLIPAQEEVSQPFHSLFYFIFIELMNNHYAAQCFEIKKQNKISGSKVGTPRDYPQTMTKISVN